MSRNRAAAIIIGVLICAPLLALYHLGAFNGIAAWFGALYGRMFVIREPLRHLLPVQYGYYTVLTFVSAWVCVEMVSQWRRFAYLLGATFLTMTLAFLLVFTGTLFEPVSGILGIWLAGIAAIGVSGWLNGYRTHIMRGLFAGRLSTKAFEELDATVEPSKLTGKREITVMSVRVLNPAEMPLDIEGVKFEQLSDHIQRSVTEFVVTRGGYLDDCDVESVRVIFGFPLADEHHALHAAQVAAALRAHLVMLAREVEQKWGKTPRFGVALTTGESMCGLLGMDDFQSFSASGEACDFSDRLCLLNGIYGTRVLLSAKTYARVKDNIEVRPMEMLYTTSGQPQGEVYELLAEKGTLPEQDARARDAFWQGVVQYRQGESNKALESFQNATVEGREDAPVRYFIDLVTASLKDGGKGVRSVPKHGRLITA
ncbi:MAG: hypothetical protein HS117_00155 [Verrucomicrobiaceae bacterium]|jgi:class 3 adenylate cyclase|nr:hypothetical protein [Verrucomicrobiaceae bacterium]